MSDPGYDAFLQARAALSSAKFIWTTSGAPCSRSNAYCSTVTGACVSTTTLSETCGTNNTGLDPNGICTTRCKYSTEAADAFGELWISQLDNTDTRFRFLEQELETERRILINGSCSSYGSWMVTGTGENVMCVRTPALIAEELEAWKIANQYSYPICYWNYSSNPNISLYCGCFNTLAAYLARANQWTIEKGEQQQCNDDYITYEQSLANWTTRKDSVEANFRSNATNERLYVPYQRCSSCTTSTQFCEWDQVCNRIIGSGWISDVSFLTCNVNFNNPKGWEASWACKRGASAIDAQVQQQLNQWTLSNPKPALPCREWEVYPMDDLSISCCTQYFMATNPADSDFNALTTQCYNYLLGQIKALNDQYVPGAAANAQKVGVFMPENSPIAGMPAPVPAPVPNSSTNSSLNTALIIGLSVGGVVLLIIVIVIAVVISRKKNVTVD